jgi:hypothetical protein
MDVWSEGEQYLEALLFAVELTKAVTGPATAPTITDSGPQPGRNPYRLSNDGRPHYDSAFGFVLPPEADAWRQDLGPDWLPHFESSLAGCDNRSDLMWVASGPLEAVTWYITHRRGDAAPPPTAPSALASPTRGGNLPPNLERRVGRLRDALKAAADTAHRPRGPHGDLDDSLRSLYDQLDQWLVPPGPDEQPHDLEERVRQSVISTYRYLTQRGVRSTVINT